MGWRDLPTLAEMQAQRRAQPKRTRVDRAIQNDADKRQDAAKLRKWALAVKARDKWIDRYDGQPIIKTLELVPRQAQAHHIVPRSDKAVRYDVRNGIALSLTTHDLVERNELVIVGTRFFTKAGKRYIDATHPVSF